MTITHLSPKEEEGRTEREKSMLCGWFNPRTCNSKLKLTLREKVKSRCLRQITSWIQNPSEMMSITE
jgi:hypothetical protein